jgi:hypothetical protein
VLATVIWGNVGTNVFLTLLSGSVLAGFGGPQSSWADLSRVLSGHVESIAYGIEDQNRSTSSELLAFVNPTFCWVRLARRIPARIKLDDVPPDLLLVAGRTATVSIGKIRWW